MRIAKLGSFAAALAVVGMQLAPTAAAVTVAAPKTADVSLQKGGVLVGQITDAKGASVEATPVWVFSQGKKVAQVQTDKSGKFAVQGLKGGVYHVASAGNVGAYRLWAPETAPPAAKQGIMFVSKGDFALGQYGGPSGPFGPVIDFVTKHPILTGAGIAAAIAIPIAVDDDDDPPAS